MKKRMNWRDVGTFVIFGGPSLIAFFAVMVLPLMFGLYLTFTDWSMQTGTHSLIWFDNYKSAFSDKAFMTQLWFTIKYVFFTAIIANVGAFF